MASNATISFDREHFNEYKKLINEAVTNKQENFIWKNSIVRVSRANRLIEKLGKGFEDATAETVTIPYFD